MNQLLKGRYPPPQYRIYGKEIKVEFLKFVRQEKKFDSLEELKKQMYKDIDFGIKYYANVTEMC